MKILIASTTGFAVTPELGYGGRGYIGKFCECGCGLVVKQFNNRFLKGHHSRLVEIRDKIAKSKQGISRPDMRGEKNPMANPEVLAQFYGENNPFYGRKHTKESKQKMRQSTIGMSSGNKNPMYGRKRPDSRLRLLIDNPAKRLEVRAKISKALKGKPWNGKHSVEGLRKISEANRGLNNPRYNGGGKDYGYGFTKILKKEILFRDNYRCLSPFCKENSTRLDIHHIDSNKKNNEKGNLITVCRSCNTRASLKIEMNKFRSALDNIMSLRFLEGGFGF